MPKTNPKPKAKKAPAPKLMCFSDALKLMKNDNLPVARKGWNGRKLRNGGRMFIAIQKPSNRAKHPFEPFIYMNTVDNKRVPWLASQTDMLAEDWVVE